MRLAPFLALRVPELHGREARSCHLQIAREEHIAGLTVHGFLAIAVSEDLEHGEFAASNLSAEPAKPEERQRGMEYPRYIATSSARHSL
jgi:hypothetical protein